MGTNLPKQFLLLNGKPVLQLVLERFNMLLPGAQLIVTLPAIWQSYWKELLSQMNVKIPHDLSDGGEERFHSVKNALSMATGEYVLVHDAVRPLFSDAAIQRCLKGLDTAGAVVPVVPIKESVREMVGTDSKALDRNKFVLVQTPQCFHRETLLTAYDQPFDKLFTDDASVVERTGVKITLVEGNEENIKLTTPQDMKLAELLLQGDSSSRIEYGF